jgi:hypothetical protein
MYWPKHLQFNEQQTNLKARASLYFYSEYQGKKQPDVSYDGTVLVLLEILLQSH